MGNAKLKAEELVDRYFELSTSANNRLNRLRAKEYALIAVEEIIDSLQIKNYSQADQYEYWSEVKYYVEKL